jgi:ubiquinone/menaquinone biosynthesis C-methylase UbiE
MKKSYWKLHERLKLSMVSWVPQVKDIDRNIFSRIKVKATDTIRNYQNTAQLNKILNSVFINSTLTSAVSLKRLFENVDDDFWFWLYADGYTKNPLVHKLLPSMPNEKIQNQFAGASGYATLRQAFSAYKLFKQIARNSSKDLSHCNKILDFGCGWGRIVRFFLKDIESSGLYGIDCDSDIINLCKQSNMKCNFETVNPMPPTLFFDNIFDVIYCYSVFSHLSEEAHIKWLVEFQRILKPGGLVIATTRPRNFINICDELRKRENIQTWQRGTTASFPNTELSLSDYDSGKYCHSATGGGGIRDSSFYGETCIPKRYVEEHWTKYFTLVDFIYNEEHKIFDQNVIVVKKLARV